VLKTFVSNFNKGLGNKHQHMWVNGFLGGECLLFCEIYSKKNVQCKMCFISENLLLGVFGLGMTRLRLRTTIKAHMDDVEDDKRWWGGDEKMKTPTRNGKTVMWDGRALDMHVKTTRGIN
jgi:hypothetical protein